MHAPPQAGNPGPLQISWRTLSLIAACALGVTLFLTFRNMGLYASIFADEYIYSLYSRHAPRGDSTFPSYLFLFLFSSTRQCGPAFLDCARVINVALLVSAMPFIYAVTRLVASRPASLLVAVLAMLGPNNTYTAYFMPDTMYFLGFWVVTWFVLRVAPAREGVFGAGLGGLIGLLAMVKMHGMFLFAGLACFFAWGFLTKTRPFSLARAVEFAACTVVAFFAVRFVGGFVLAGRAGLHLLGAVYGGVANSSPPRDAAMFQQVAGVASSHALGLLVLFGVPLGLALSPRAKDTPAAQRTVERYLLSILVPIFAIVSLFTVSISGAGPYELMTRVHMRYYNFLFPLFLIVVAGHLSISTLQVMPQWGRAQRVIFALLAVPAAYAVFIHLVPITPVLADCPELTGLMHDSQVFTVVGGLGVVSLALAAAMPRRGLALYALVFFPLCLGFSAWWANFELRDRRESDAYDRAGEFARKYLGARSSQVLVAGPQVAGLYRAQFALDDPGAHLVTLAEGQALSPEQLLPDIRWVLYIGEHLSDPAAVADTASQGFLLVPARP